MADGGRAWLAARNNLMDKVMPWEPIKMPRRSMPPRCALNPFLSDGGRGAPSLQATRPFLQTRSNEEPDPSLMLDEKSARAHLRALRLYTPVGMICNMLDMQTPSAHLEPFAAHDDEGISVPTKWSSVPWERGAWARVGGDHLIIDERDEEVAAINSPHSASSVHAALMDKAETRRRPSSAGPWAESYSQSANMFEEGVRERPNSANASAHRARPQADRHRPVFRDQAAFERLGKRLERTPNADRLCRQLARMEAKGLVTRSQPVFRPSSASAFRGTKSVLFNSSPYMESPASQLQAILHIRTQGPKADVRRPTSAVSVNRSNPALGHSLTLGERSKRPSSALGVGRHSATPAPTGNTRLTYIPPRPASAMARIDVGCSQNRAIRKGKDEWSTKSSGAQDELTDIDLKGKGSGGQRRQRTARDFIRLFCCDTGKCFRDAACGEWGSGTMIWRRHASAYTRIPRYLKENGDLTTLSDMLTDCHFVTQGIICSGVEMMVAAMSSAIAALILAERQAAAGESRSWQSAAVRQLQRIRDFQVFVQENYETLDKEPYKLFVLGRQLQEKGNIPPSVAHQLDRSLRVAAETIEDISAKYIDDHGAPSVPLNRVMMAHEYLEMLMTHGCVECLTEVYNEKVHTLLGLFSKFISKHAKDTDADTCHDDLTLANRVRCSLMHLKKRDVPSMSDSLTLAPAASSTRQLYIDISVPPAELSTITGIEELKSELKRDAAAVLGITSADLEIDRLTGSSARLTYTQDIPAAELSELGMHASYTGRIVCFNRRPASWEYITVYVSADQSTPAELRKAVTTTALSEMREVLRERYVDLSVVDLDEGNTTADSRRAHRNQATSVLDTRGDSILVVVLPGNDQKAAMSQVSDIVFLEFNKGGLSAEQVEKTCLALIDVLWAELSKRFRQPTDARVGQTYPSVAAYNQLLEMQGMAQDFVKWQSRKELMQRMIDFTSVTDFSKPVLAELSGVHGSGKSSLLAAIAHETMVMLPNIQTIYFRSAPSQVDRPHSLVSHICWLLVGSCDPPRGQSRTVGAGVEGMVEALLQTAMQRSIVIIADEIDDEDHNVLRAALLRPEFASLRGRVRVIYSLRGLHPENRGSRKAAFRLQPLETLESEEFLTRLCTRLHLPLNPTLKQTLLAKKQAGNPLYLSAAAHHLSLICEQRQFQTESRDKKYDLLAQVCHQLPGDIDYMIEDQVITLLECQYGQELVWRVLEYLYHDEGGLSVQDLTTMLGFHSKQTTLVTAATITALCNDLVRSAFFRLKPSGHVCMNLQSVRRAVARRYFAEYTLDDREKRAVVARCHLAQKCSDQVQETRLKDISEQEKRSELSDRVSEKDAVGFDGIDTFTRHHHYKGAKDKDTSEAYIDEKIQHDSILGSEGTLAEASVAGTRSGARKRASKAREKDGVKIPPNTSIEVRKFEDCIHQSVADIHECHRGGVLCITVAHHESGGGQQGHYICTGGADHDVKVWDFLFPADNVEEKYAQLRDERDANLQDLPDLFFGLKHHLRNYCLDAHVRIRLSGHRGAVVCLASGGGLLMSGSTDKSIRLWSLDTFKCIGTLHAHRSVVSSLQYSTSSGALISAGHDGKIRTWNVKTKTCTATIDSTKRAGIYSIVARCNRIFAGCEKRWNETMNPIKVWKMDLSVQESAECGELPSKEMQQLARDAKQREEALDRLTQEIKHLHDAELQQQAQLALGRSISPLRTAQVHNALTAAEDKERRHREELQGIQERFLQLKGDVYPVDDVYCMQAENCERGARGKVNVLFVGGNFKHILAWDVDTMECIEAMNGPEHEADYTRCVVAANGFLYSGGGKLKHHERLAASSVAMRLKLQDTQHEIMETSGVGQDEMMQLEQNCGRVTVWCTSSLKPLGSMTFESVIMSLSAMEHKLFVGGVDGKISIFSHTAGADSFRAQMTMLVEQGTAANSMIATNFETRRKKLEDAKVPFDILRSLVESIADPALATALLIEMGKALAKQHPIASLEREDSCSLIDFVLQVMARYRGLVRLQVHAINVLSLCSSTTDLCDLLLHGNLGIVSEVMRCELKDVEAFQRAGCLLYLELLSPLEVEVGPSSKKVRSPHISSPKDSALNIPSAQPAKRQGSNLANLENAETTQDAFAAVVDAGGLLAALTSVGCYCQAGCARDAKDQADTAVLELAVPLLRLLATQRPSLCKGVVDTEGTDALDRLESDLLDEKAKLEKATGLALKDNNPLIALISDLKIAQGAMGIKIRGKPLPKPIKKHAPASDLLDQFFPNSVLVEPEHPSVRDVPPTRVQSPVQGKANRRANKEVWVKILKDASQQAY